MSRKEKLPLAGIRAQFQPASIDAEKRCVEIVWSTGAPVKRWWGETFLEVLSMESGHVRMSRLESGNAPLLDTHSQFKLKDVIGVVEKAWIKDGEGRAIVRFSKRAEVEPIWQDVVDGVLKNISVGYAVHKYERQPQAEGEAMPIYRAIDWEPMELSPFRSVPTVKQEFGQVMTEEVSANSLTKPPRNQARRRVV